MNNTALEENKILAEKYHELLSSLKSFGRLLVAFSGGADSAFLLKAAKDALGENVLAVTASSCLFPKRDLIEAADFCRENSICHIVFESNELEIDGFADNPENRCYICKKELFKKMQGIAQENGIEYLAEGSNLDDCNDYRPGMAAIKELGVISPLREQGFTKAEIREASRLLGLPTHSKPSLACLASRFVYGERITKEKLEKIERAEQLLRDMGFTQVRVRLHGNLARIELGEEELGKLLHRETAHTVYGALKKMGFSYAALDLLGYRTGSMNETLDNSERMDYNSDKLNETVRNHPVCKQN